MHEVMRNTNGKGKEGVKKDMKQKCTDKLGGCREQGEEEIKEDQFGVPRCSVG